MRLLRKNDDAGYKLVHFAPGDEIPPYAILSHTWISESQEINFEDIASSDLTRKPGSYAKLQFCDRQAARDGLHYFWVDTCCINKASSQELQEAITSMYQWYQDAARCYAYLADVSTTENQVNTSTSRRTWQLLLRQSRWFTRGWTLQELLAPAFVEFFSAEGIWLGDKQSLAVDLHDVTGIPYEVLQGTTLAKFSVEERLSWAKHRQTTRKEDKAYSLLGILSVSMPIIYGEGEERALARLHEEVDKEDLRASRAVSHLPITRQAAFNSIENQHGSTCLPNTRVELLRKIADWASKGQKPLLWLNGIAGTGKSTIARTIARTYHERGELGASFFFTRGSGGIGRSDRLFTTLASQMASSIPALRRPISEAISKDADIAERSFRDQWDELILRPLIQIDRTCDPLTIMLIIDALDECESERNVRAILRLFAAKNAFVHIRLRILITSRPELSIRSSFSQMPEAERQFFVLHNIAPSTVDRDLSLFFKHNFSLIREEERGLAADWPDDGVIRQLVEASCGLFIWASTACRFIAEGRQFAAKRISMLMNNHVTGTEPEKHLDKIYMTVLSNSMQQDYWEDEKQSVQDTLRRVIGSIAILRTPLPKDALATLIHLSSTDVDATLADLHSVFNVPTARDGAIRLHHPTFREFIVDRKRCEGLEFWVDEQKSHRMLADDCIQLMSKLLRRDICDLGEPGILARDVDKALVRSRIPPELEYACCNWVQHYRQCGSRLDDNALPHEFIQRHLLNWLEVMALMGKTSEVALILRMYAALLIPEHSLRAWPLVHDARRLFFLFQSTIEKAPLQVYCTAIAFIPRYFQLRSHFWPELKHWVRDVRVVEAYQPRRPRPKPEFMVNHIVFTPDGQYIASGSTEPEVRLWDVKSGTTRGTYQRLTKKEDPYSHREDYFRVDGMRAVAFSKDQTRIASGSDDALVTVWDSKSRAVKHTLTGHQTWVNCVSFSPNGGQLATGSMDETIKIWDLDTGQELHTFKGVASCVNDIAFSADGSLLASSSSDNVVRLWDVKLGQVRVFLDGHQGSVNTVQFSPDGSRVISGSDDKTVRIWDVHHGKELKLLRGHGRKVLCVAFSWHGQLCASGSEDMDVKIWDAMNGVLLNTLRHTSGINAIAFSPKAELLASSTFDDELKLWNSKTGEALGTFEGHEGEESMPLLLETMAMDANTDSAATMDQTGHSSAITCTGFSPNGTILASGSRDATIRLWKNQESECQVLEDHTAGVNHVAFSPTASTIASASSDGTVKTWDTSTGELRHTLQGHSEPVRLLRFSADGQYIVSCSQENTAILWHTDTGTLYMKLEGHTSTFTDVAFSPSNNDIIASCSTDSTVRLWTISSRASKIIKGHSDSVNSVAFSSDGKMLVSCSADGDILLWDTMGTSLGELEGHTQQVNFASFSRDSKFVVSCSDDETIKIWDVQSAAALFTLTCGVIVRTCTFSSCGRFLETDRGVLDIRLPTRFSGTNLDFGMFVSRERLKVAGKDLLWLPKEYEAVSVATRAGLVAMGHESGAISFVYL